MLWVARHAMEWLLLTTGLPKAQQLINISWPPSPHNKPTAAMCGGQMG